MWGQVQNHKGSPEGVPIFPGKTLEGLPLLPGGYTKEFTSSTRIVGIVYFFLSGHSTKEFASFLKGQSMKIIKGICDLLHTM